MTDIPVAEKSLRILCNAILQIKGQLLSLPEGDPLGDILRKSLDDLRANASALLPLGGEATARNVMLTGEPDLIRGLSGADPVVFLGRSPFQNLPQILSPEALDAALEKGLCLSSSNSDPDLFDRLCSDPAFADVLLSHAGRLPLFPLTPGYNGITDLLLRISPCRAAELAQVQYAAFPGLARAHAAAGFESMRNAWLSLLLISLGAFPGNDLKSGHVSGSARHSFDRLSSAHGRAALRRALPSPPELLRIFSTLEKRTLNSGLDRLVDHLSNRKGAP